MCLIIHREEGMTLSEEFLGDVRSRNPDGWGILYHNADGEAEVEKGLTMLDFYKSYDKLVARDEDCIIHFRYATHGTVNLSNAHPYVVLGGKNPIYLMHNGTIDIAGAEKSKGKLSDTRIFIRDVLKPMLNAIKDPHKFIRSKEFEFMMESVASDNSSRFVLFDREGSLFYGGWHQTTTGIWVSNTYAFSVDNPDEKKKDDWSNFTYSGGGTGYVRGKQWCKTTQSYRWPSEIKADKQPTGSIISLRDSVKEVNPYFDHDDYGIYDLDDSDEIERMTQEDAWLESIQDVADNFQTVAEGYWNLTDQEIEYAIQMFYGGSWTFTLDSAIPSYSVITDLDGKTISPEDIIFMVVESMKSEHKIKKAI